MIGNFVRNVCVNFDLAHRIHVSFYRGGQPMIPLQVIPCTLSSGYNNQGMSWFTTGILNIASLWMKVKMMVTGLEFPTKWAKYYAIRYCLYP